MGRKKIKIIGKPPPDWNFCVGKETRVSLAELEVIIMTTYTLEGKRMVVDEERLNDLAKRWLPTGMSANFKREFADYVRFLIADLELDEPFYDCDGVGVSVEQYYFLACLIYAWNNGYESILECDDDLKIFDCLDSVTEEIYDEFIERTKDENGETDTEYFMKWVNEENWDERNRKWNEDFKRKVKLWVKAIMKNTQ